MDGSGLLAVVELRQARVDGVLDRAFSLTKIDGTAPVTAAGGASRV